MDKRLLDILCCPVTHAPLRALSAPELDAVNRAIAGGQLRDEGGRACARALAEGLITRDGRTIYGVTDGIPVLLADHAMATSSIEGFPRT
jgi:uncharacterized protein YbaR (Trm112 family)